MENKKTRVSIFVRLMKVLDERLVFYLCMILVMTMTNAIYKIVSSYLLKDILDMAQRYDSTGLWQKVIVNVLIGVLAMLVWRWSTIHYNIEAKRGIARLEKRVFSKAARLPMSYYENNHSGDFMSRLIYDTGKAGDIFGSRFRRLVAPAISVVVYFVPMCTLCWELSVSLLIVSIITFIVNGLYIEPMKKVGASLSKSNALLSQKLIDIISAVDLIKIFAASDRLCQDYYDENENYKKNTDKQNRLSGQLDGISFALEMSCNVIFLLLGVMFLSKGIVSLGSLAAVYTMYGAFNWHFLQLGRYMPEMTNSLMNAQRVFEFIDMEEEKERFNIDGTKSKAYIAMENIEFGYNEERKILNGASLEVFEGECVALVGESGKGKSTLLKLLLGFYEIQGGNISIAGKSYKDYTIEEIRDMIAYVPQEPYLYEVSIYDNIAYGKANATKEEIIAAAKAASAHDFIMALKDGYDTIPGERGNRLSGGEKQRISIARAILKNAPILILDEATSALDNESEQLVSEAINNLMDNRTTIMIAHRPATIARADRIVEIG